MPPTSRSRRTRSKRSVSGSPRARRTTERARPKVHTRARVGVRNGEKAAPGTGRGVARLLGYERRPQRSQGSGCRPAPGAASCRCSATRVILWASTRTARGGSATSSPSPRCSARSSSAASRRACGRSSRCLPRASAAGRPNPVSPLLGEASLLLSGGARHARDRKLLTPPFHGARLRAYGRTMWRARGEAASWTPGAAVRRCSTRRRRSRSDVILRAVFGMDDGCAATSSRGAARARRGHGARSSTLFGRSPTPRRLRTLGPLAAGHGPLRRAGRRSIARPAAAARRAARTSSAS